MTKARSNAVAAAAKGDLTVGTGTNLSGILPVGANGEIFVADASTSTGLRYQVPKMQQMFINSAMDNWQRGLTGAGYVSSGGFVADRFQGIRGAAAAGMTMSRQTAQNSDLPNVQYCNRLQRDSGNTSTQAIRLFYSAESTDSIPFAGQAITFSYYVRKGANYSGGDVSGQIYSGTGTDQNLGITGFTGFTLVVDAVRTSATLTTSWTRVQATATVAATASQLGLLLLYTPTGTAGANDWIEVTGFQLEAGSIATAFKRQSGSIQGELAACQRYYYRNSATGGAYSVLALGGNTATTTARFLSALPVTLRTSPTALDFSTLAVIDTAGTITAVTNLVLDGVNAVFATSSGMTANRPSYLYSNNSTAGFIGYSAEL